MTYLDKVKIEEKNTIAVDFDGVLHDDFLGYHDGSIYGKIIDGASDALKQLHERGYKIVIFTAKAKPDRPLYENKTGTELVWEWLRKHQIDKFIDHVTCEKPRAQIYIDDKGYKFNNWETTLLYISNK